MTDYPNESARAFFTPASTIHKEDPDRDRYCKPFASDNTPPPEGSCPYVGNKPFYATTLRVCQQGCTCNHYHTGQYNDCPIYLHNNRIDTKVATT